ncbi:Beta-galactosidase C-terminal domain [Streptomyces sp. AS02]|uniref:Beta-galactosidase C-terminal domain n=1 Tax=Streptomyces sp. AS02 TaxID=2938946 RepID=UPI002021FA4E|nr:Beta-galactosidase C-terminal domain [Streptomyces sp. AS02]MCL8012028.1 Beta-galactosidase C-terminal domain [Streptomyces sp. AS02]
MLDCVAEAGVTPVLDTPEGVEAVRRRGADGTDRLFLLNHNGHEVTVDLAHPRRSTRPR